MILELDCGNSFIKWRLIERGSDARVVACGMCSDPISLLDKVAGGTWSCPASCRLVSVRGEQETNALVHALRDRLGVEVACATPAPSLAGVINGYRDYQRLGLDRWMAIVGAYQLCHGPCVVIDLGTAVTIDLIDGGGRHLGGFIAPGMELLTAQLRSHTKRIVYDAQEASAALSETSPGRSTSEAVERGCIKMLRAYVEGQIDEAGQMLGEGMKVYVAGGDSSLLAGLPVEFVPDLVFKGLAIACPV